MNKLDKIKKIMGEKGVAKDIIRVSNIMMFIGIGIIAGASMSMDGYLAPAYAFWKGVFIAMTAVIIGSTVQLSHMKFEAIPLERVYKEWMNLSMLSVFMIVMLDFLAILYSLNLIKEGSLSNVVNGSLFILFVIALSLDVNYSVIKGYKFVKAIDSVKEKGIELR